MKACPEKVNFPYFFHKEWSLLNALFSKKSDLAPIAAEISCYIIPTIDCWITEDVNRDNKW